MSEILAKVLPVLAQFQLRGQVVEACSWGSGHINDTYRITVRQGGWPIHYILQRINTRVFPDAELLMDNISKVTGCISEAAVRDGNPDPSRATMTIVPTVDGRQFFRDADGSCYRVYVFIEGAHTVDAVTSPDQCRQAARAFGNFQYLLRDLPGNALGESIRDFHYTPKCFTKFQSVLSADKLNRAASCKAEIDFALAREEMCHVVTDKLASGELPLRVTHNDTKINNVMLDDATGEGICVIDLDTVMPGSVLYDFGDQIRTSTSMAAEDERDLSKVIFDLELFKPLLEGYLETASGFLTAAERELLPFSGRLLTFECGLRFLTDYLEGDVYFKVHRDGHNLDRCRTQFELVRQMENAADKTHRM